VKTKLEQFGTGLYRIPLPVDIDGFSGFISTWVHTAGPTVIVDVGPSATTPFLLEALAEIGVTHPDLILLTHIHIDHAGGIGEVARAFAGTPVVCHPKAIEHLVDPRRLWEGSAKSLGDVARRYGPIAPVDAKQILAVDHLDWPQIIPIPTPGHAPHHHSYLIGDLLFAGEAGGVCITIADGPEYMRPATPPRFFLETSLDSIDRLIARQPQRICYGHVGMRGNAAEMLRVHRDQLLRWKWILVEWLGKTGPMEEAELLKACVEHLLLTDPLMAGFAQLTPQARERERFFLRNSVKGYRQYLQGA
jgi:glyoxylase-like metal-dependent hydrolase (beta-lactamase superfamily II)